MALAGDSKPTFYSKVKVFLGVLNLNFAEWGLTVWD